MADAPKDDRPTPDATLTDRRRPGRVDYQDAQLLALLRDQPTKTKPASAESGAVPEVRRTDPANDAQAPRLPAKEKPAMEPAG